jgi:hypothetical protein
VVTVVVAGGRGRVLQRVGMGQVEGGRVVLLYCGEGRTGGWRKMMMKKRNNLRNLVPYYIIIKTF